ncbi:DUF5060 domain-containing protein [Cohnella herbarum]|uniref:DUF4038 domain-containing protein n=1 Tax=Cohnella herbarum TaxID=2728023 RepID=A0A7Z2VL02_9BACL|nr:DUF5060 domain-containing protein [Cohnella herbarum]QJD85007.1 DUF4038 domain-containing protein [Cohnella herbarum]
MKYSKQVEQWDIFEIELQFSNLGGNPFRDIWLQATFKIGDEFKRVNGFYDGGTTWRIRFMPETTGNYRFQIHSNVDRFNGLEGHFTSTMPSEGNHGPVQVNGVHFNYADGTPFFVMGTTAYAWTYRPEEVRLRTLESFAKYGFNKIRMLVFPKYYRGLLMDVNVDYDPPVFPFAGKPNEFDFQTLVPEYFRNFEERVMDLMRLGIEADVILFHPYDTWGIDSGMRQADDLFYVNYLISRLAAYRNVWWSLANEYDISSTPEGMFCSRTDRKDWDLIGTTIKSNDPHGHPISVHNLPMRHIYPDRDWLSHVSIQHPDTYTLLSELKHHYKKPIVNDEYQYEGNIKDEWGNSDGATTLFRHWLSAMAGCYASHGEVFKVDGNETDLFWSYGGTLIGDSAPRLKFMKEILESCAYQDMNRDWANTDGHHYFALNRGIDEYLFFCRYDLPGKGFWFGSYDGSRPEYDVIVYDAWNCIEKDRLTVKEIEANHLLPIKAWTVYRLKRKKMQM